MVRTVQVDEAVQAYADQRMLKRAEAEVKTPCVLLIL
jgi:hypothetical protein